MLKKQQISARNKLSKYIASKFNSVSILTEDNNRKFYLISLPRGGAIRVYSLDWILIEQEGKKDEIYNDAKSALRKINELKEETTNDT